MIKVSMSGLDGLQRQLDETAAAAGALDGPLGEVSLVPGDRESLAAAVAEMEREIDGRVARWRHNSTVAEMAAAAKAHFRAQLTEKAGP